MDTGATSMMQTAKKLDQLCERYRAQIHRVKVATGREPYFTLPAAMFGDTPLMAALRAHEQQHGRVWLPETWQGDSP